MVHGWTAGAREGTFFLEDGGRGGGVALGAACHRGAAGEVGGSGIVRVWGRAFCCYGGEN